MVWDVRRGACGVGRGADTSGAGVREATRKDSPMDDGVGGQMGGGEGGQTMGGTWKSKSDSSLGVDG
jgi:hypothetical protein